MARPRHRDLALTLVTAAVAFCVFWPIYEHFVRHGGSRSYAWRDVTGRLGPFPFPRPSGRLFKTQRNLSRYVDAADPGRRAPRILAKGKEALLVAAGPRSSTGYDVRIVSVTEQRSRILVRVREHTPRLGDAVRPTVTSPYRLLAFHTTDKPVFLDWQGRP